MTNHLELAVDRQLPHVSKRIADCMRRLGWEGPQKMRICGESVRGFRRPSVNGDAENEPEHLQDPVSENEVPF